jgi:hypothetical protein
MPDSSSTTTTGILLPVEEPDDTALDAGSCCVVMASNSFADAFYADNLGNVPGLYPKTRC